MAVSKRIQEISFGGNAVNNPPDYSWTTYDNYPDLDLGLVYMRMNIIYYDDVQKINLQVTGLVILNQFGQPMIQPNDLVYLPCPPACP
jgi:hypothetical protein